MRPIPAPRIGESHGLLRAISQRDRIRLDEFVTEFQSEDLFPPELENAQGRTRQFVSYARSAGLLKDDRGVVELTEIGKRYVRAGDDAAPFEVSEAQADWLRRQLLEKHMTDSIFHGLAIGLSLLSSVAPGTRISTLDFGRALGYLGRASASARMRAARCPAFFAPALPMATVATGTPGGIWTTAYSASAPPRAPPSSGIPITGFAVRLASTPGRWAARPAAPMNRRTPAASASAT
jgi:hypothetical protein